MPKWDSATASGQRSAAQNGQDSSLTKTIAVLPPMSSGRPGLGTASSGVAAWPALTRASRPAGTVVTWLTTLGGASDSLAVGLGAVSFTATRVATMASTAVIAATGIQSRRHASARLRAARWAAIRSRARCRGSWARCRPGDVRWTW